MSPVWNMDWLQNLQVQAQSLRKLMVPSLWVTDWEPLITLINYQFIIRQTISLLLTSFLLFHSGNVTCFDVMKFAGGWDAAVI